MRVVISRLSVALLVAALASPAGAATSTLADAVKKQNKAAVDALLRQPGIDVNAPQADGATALHWAAHWDDVDTVRRLLRAGANVNAGNVYGVTPLALAAENASAAVVEALLEAGANPNSATATGETPLMTAAWTGSIPVTKLLLTRGADINAKEGSEGHTPLMWAIAERHTDVAEFLIERGASVTARSVDGFTPLMFAARMGDLETAKLLLAKGASPSEQVPKGPSALVVATVRSHTALATYLLEQGADPNAAGAGYTALHWASGTWETEVVGKNGIALPSSSDHEWYATPGLRRDRLALVRLLLLKGADPNARIVREPARTGFTRGGLEGRRLIGATPFLLAAQAGEVEVMKALAAAGADPSLTTLAAGDADRADRAVDHSGMTALMAAAGVGRVVGEAFITEERALEAARLAIELGNDVNAVNAFGETALHGAAHTRNNALVQLLVDKGARLDARTTKDINNWERAGQTPLVYAERHLQYMGAPVIEKTSTGELLRKLGAKE